MSFLPVILAVAAAGFQAYSAISQANYERQVSDYNRQENLRAADDARRAAARDAEVAQAEGERTIGRATALAGASGFDLSGSAADIVGDLAGQMRYDTRAIIYAGDIERRQYLHQANLDQMRGKNATTQGWLGAGAAILNGGYNVARYTQTAASTRAPAGGARTPTSKRGG